MEDRIERLEELSALQERTIEELHLAIFDQQKRIDRLERRVELLNGKVRELNEGLEQTGRSGMDDPPPPHYGGD